jgi:hypothetical protein
MTDHRASMEPSGQAEGVPAKTRAESSEMRAAAQSGMEVADPSDMGSWFSRWFGYGLGSAAGKAIFGEDEGPGHRPPPEPIRQQTEAEIREAEKRYDEDEKRLDAEDEAQRKRDQSTPSTS